MSIVECIEKVNELKAILEQVSFTLYFQPENAINVVGLDTLDNLAIDIQGAISLLSRPTPPTSS